MTTAYIEMDEHARKVERVIHQLRELPAGVQVSRRKRAVSHQVPKRNDARHREAKIDVSDLDAILEIDPVARTCTAEPGVTFVDLVRETMRYGLAPFIVPELATITIGGAVSGCSIESMSFREGGFHDTCLEYEVITAKGEILRTTRGELLFEMMHGSFGTLGVLSKIRFRLARVRPFVHVVFERYLTIEDYLAAILERSRDERVELLDGFVYSPISYVLCVGRFVANAPYTTRYDRANVFFQTAARTEEDYLRTEDYFFRYDNGVTNVHPKSAIARALFGPALRSANLLRIAEKLHRFLPERPDVTLDMFFPISRVPAFLEWWDAAFAFYPLWVVPYKRVRDYPWIAPEYWKKTHDPMFVDLACYGMKQAPGTNAYVAIEHALEKLGGLKTLISYNHYDEETFWRIFDRKSYQEVKRVTDPDNVFRDLWNKTCRAPFGLE